MKNFQRLYNVLPYWIARAYTVIFRLLCLLLSLPLQAQDINEEELYAIQSREVVQEGIRLYRCEQASWSANDIFSAAYPERSDDIGGYLSYASGAGMRTIFYSSTSNPAVIATVYFDSTLTPANAFINKTERYFTVNEKALYLMQEQAFADIRAHAGVFTSYRNTTFNLVPLIDSNERKVYVITGLRQSCLVIFGNDYLITFDDRNTVVSRRQFHKNMMPVECAGNAILNKTGTGSIHVHSSDGEDLITATDICTLMLYEKQANWKQHTVFSKKQVCIWNCETNALTRMSIEGWREMHRQETKN